MPFNLERSVTYWDRFVRLVFPSFLSPFSSSGSPSSSSSVLSSPSMALQLFMPTLARRTSSGMFLRISLFLLRLASLVRDPNRMLKRFSSEEDAVCWVCSLPWWSYGSQAPLSLRLLSLVSMLSWEDVLKRPASRLANKARFSGESISSEWARCSRPSWRRSMLRMVAARWSLSWISTLRRRRVSRNSARTFAFHSAAWALNSPTCDKSAAKKR